jgi:type III secretion protein V
MNLSSYFHTAVADRESPLAKYSDLLLVAGIIAVIALMVLPLPLFIIDLLVAVNLAIGVMLLLMAVYIGSPLEFSAFPSVLLISTLFRLSLGIATTRMILLHGDAGHIIDTFGKTVAGGNLVVGMVVFIIITVVQFIVIAKGAERVAEVSARFTLDAMPGKQMSIDSDLRSGLIDKDEARKKRMDLEMESKLHGNMDGAMKFVKGDAIAGIVIIVVNLLGGLTVGVMQQGMDLGHAMTKYSVLTIGDGMVSQIPALLGAMAAGLIVTRTSDARDKHMGDTIRKQFTAKPRVLLVSGAICWMMALIPGFPATTFVVLGLVLAGGGALLTPLMRARIEKFSEPAFGSVIARKEAQPGVLHTALPGLQPSVPLLLALPTKALGHDHGEALRREMEAVLEFFQLGVGLALPKISIHARPASEGVADEWQLLAFEVPIAKGEVPTEDTTAALGHAVRQALRRHVGLFMGIQEATTLMTAAGKDYPDTVKEVLRVMPIQRVADVLRRMVEEEVPVRHQREMLEALAESAQREKDVPTLVELVRIHLKRHISYRYAPIGNLNVVLLLADLEDMLRKSLQTAGGVQQVALDPTTARQVIDALRGAVERHPGAVFVTTVDLRRHVRKLVELECFDVPVLSYHELMPLLKLEVVERIGAPGKQLLEAA